jgi:SOS-response transcriptional repressor LexA
MKKEDVMRAQGARLADARRDAGFKSGRSAALACGWAESTYRSHEKGKRTIGQDDAEKYAKAFRARGAKASAEHILFGDGWRRAAQFASAEIVNPDNILRLTYSGNKAHSGEDELVTIAPAPRPVLVPVRGATANGIWFEYEKMIEADHGLIPAVPGDYSTLEQFAYRVSDDAMDKRGIHSGNFIICVKYMDVRSKPISGDIVVVERRRGDLTERSCRELQVVGGGYELRPRSTDASFNIPIVVDDMLDPRDASGARVEIVGLVIAAHVVIAG